MQLLGSLHRAPKPPPGRGTARDLPENLRLAVLRVAAARRVREALEEGEKKKRPLRLDDLADFRIRRL